MVCCIGIVRCHEGVTNSKTLNIWLVLEATVYLIESHIHTDVPNRSYIIVV